jgi:murein DD-endopeptidase MepM/ murein hydrolase activator NlpD
MFRLATVLAAALAALSFSGRGSRPPPLPTAVADVSTTPGDVVGYVPPLAGSLVIVHAYDAPTSPYAAGERGVDLATAADSPVLAAGPGVVTFAGPVAGRGVVVMAHPDGVLTEYEPVAPSVRVGDHLRAGQLLGTVAGTHEGCATNACLHWGARRGQVYFDPMSLLEAPDVVRLLPWT